MGHRCGIAECDGDAVYGFPVTADGAAWEYLCFAHGRPRELAKFAAAVAAIKDSQSPKG